MQNMLSDKVCASSLLMVCMWDAWAMHDKSLIGAKCLKHKTNDQNMLSMYKNGNPQKFVLNGVQNNEKNTI